MNLLLLCEGNAETRDSWSGITKSTVDQLRAAGHVVRTADVDLHGADKWVAAGLTFSPKRTRWGARYRLSAEPFVLRSRRARAACRRLGKDADAILQIGATFEIANGHTAPYFLYCDSNISMAEHGAATGYSEASPLTRRELAQIRAREARVYAGASTIFTISERLRSSFIDDFGLPASRVCAVHAGPNFDVREIATRRLTKVEQGTRPPTILFVGAQFTRKGGDTLLAAFRTVRERVPSARLVVIGPERLATEAAGVTCLGFLDKNRTDHRAALLAAYASADVFCLPTRFEPFGIVFLEAMYFGLPCVGTNAWAVPEMIIDGATGYTVPVDDATLLADRLVRLLNDPALARRLGDAGRRRAESHFTWTAVVERMMRAIEPATSQRRLRS
jgi:glycosyltransferase involved in cell wall biosynthesis